MLSRGLDSETTGIDFRHGARPFFITFCDADGSQRFYEWFVDPLTRQPGIPDGDLAEIEEAIQEADLLILQNSKFDFQALTTLATDGWQWEEWDWNKVRDTLLAGHLIASNHPHDLTSMCLEVLGLDIQPFEDRLEIAVKEAQRLVRSKYPTWKLAKKAAEDMPSAKEKTWKFDTWLPRAVAREEGYSDDHPWWTVLAEYGNADSAVLNPLYKAQMEILEERKLVRIYEERLKILPIVYDMESRGVTINKQKLDALEAEYREESEAAGRVCVNIAASYGYELDLPKSGNNNSLRNFCFGEKDENGEFKRAPWLDLPALKRSKQTGEPSLDKGVIEQYQATLPENSKPLKFIEKLRDKRKRDTALSYIEGYRRFWVPLGIYNEKGEQLWYRLHPSLNPTGTDTLRWSSSNPNEQNISKQEGFNLRYAFGPALDREWWSCDAKNIELRLPAYEAGETEMIQLFERPNDPPYFGSYHLLVFDTLHPDKFAKHGVKVKDIYESTWYQWVKNGNFATQYGAVEQSGTADRAYHVPGAQRRVQGRFKNIKRLNDRMISYAEEYGYVETMPDKGVDPERGYPLLCTRTQWGKILPTVPLNYHIQGTAMWWMMKAKIRCFAYLQQLSTGTGKDYRITLQVHDECVFDLPRGKTPEENLPIVRNLMKLMEEGGNDIGVPTPVSCKYHADNWAEGVTF